MKWIDLPPIWLSACVVCVWLAPKVETFLPAQSSIGAVLVGAGLLLMCLAVLEMIRHRTTVIPHLQASHLVTSGVFAMSRNPIYLGDALILGGIILWWQAHPILFLLVPVFMWIITFRFIQPEEGRLKEAFGEAFASYCDTTRRWL